MMTATFGGLTRDILVQNPTPEKGCGRIFHSRADLYATTALFGAAVYLVLLKNPYLFGITNASIRIGAGAGSAMGLRWLARRYELGLPTWTKPEWKTWDGSKRNN